MPWDDTCAQVCVDFVGIPAKIRTDFEETIVICFGGRLSAFSFASKQLLGSNAFSMFHVKRFQKRLFTVHIPTRFSLGFAYNGVEVII